MVRKEPCNACKGNRYVPVKTAAGKESWRKCPDCAGQGYKIRVTR